MSKIPKKVKVGACIGEEDKVKLDILKEKSYIKSISEGVRRAVNSFLKEPEVVAKLHEDINQMRIPDYAEE
ncbi:hypothetical protein LCGC14_1270910 [marine sediment metagenome]|uniref:Ribbon-helix-helix protein CopG domain-containing protein n=1 Tax=marine sediment metagenome TaxID=412755 RepID=A0A0F9KZW8_9ZZZZ